ncbi:MAG: cobalt ECF transporter T component CbiQ [Oscillospiraceae bacterium]|nr:cobalt ECF transporter T component CbiQ [Oscillospiraceae bacterium]
MIVIDKICYSSGLRGVNAGEKMAFSVMTLLFCVVSRNAAVALAVFFGNTVLTLWKGRTPWKQYARLLLIPAAFVLLSTAAILVNFSRVPLDAFAVPIGEYYITGSRRSLALCIRLILTALSAASSLYFLSLSTPVTDILQVLQRLRCPTLLVELMLLTYRFIFVLAETAAAMTTAQQSRLGNRNFKTSVRSFGALGSMLFIRAVKRSARIYDAMESRCYDGKLRVLRESIPPKGAEIAGIILWGLVLFGVFMGSVLL